MGSRKQGDLFLMGVLILYTEDTDYEKWLRDFAKNFPSPEEPAEESVSE